ncbi:MAG: [Fe-Fe] hydrogenase large subunit C-terminal domain-containing protein [Clostridium sp.]
MPIIDFKAAMCKHCYKCVRGCEVKSIMIRDGHAYIMPNRCILCGQCLQICPQSAKRLSSELDKVKEFIKDKVPTVLSLSSSYIGLFHYKSRGQVKAALKKLGFTDVRDSAEGAALVTEEYVKLLEQGTMKNIITTACPSIVDLIEIHYPELIDYMAPVLTPSGVHARMIKKEYGEKTRIVFAGPCIAEKKEIRPVRQEECLDAVLTFEEINKWLQEEKIQIEQCEAEDFEETHLGANLRYPVSGGLLTAVSVMEQKQDNYRKFYVSGVRDCLDVCEAMKTGEVKDCFIEMNACHGGCINGPATGCAVSSFKVKLDMEAILPRGRANLSNVGIWADRIAMERHFSDHSQKENLPTEEEIRAILAKTGKLKPEQELNCGACGYPTCREKAVAVYQKKAELNMCIPFLHEQAKSLSHLVMETSPNIIMVLDENMKILECSAAVEKYFSKKRREMRGRFLDEFLDTEDVKAVFETHTSIHSKKVTYPEYHLTTLQNIAYITRSNLVIATFIDVTKDEELAQKEHEKKMETMELAQKVIYKQMMVAQEIAGLLGETTAETKTTLTKLCSLIDDGSEGEVK